MYAGYVKIGYASDLANRLTSLNTGMLKNFEVFAVYETPTNLADRQFHALIDDLAPIVRARVVDGQKVQDKEFFKLEPEQAYDLLEHIAAISGTEKCLHRYDEIQMPKIKNDTSKREATKKPDYYKVGTSNYKFTTWKESLIVHCEEIIAIIGFDEFQEKALECKVAEKAKQKIFAKTKEEMRGFRHYKFKQDDLYLFLNYSAEMICKIHQKLNELFPKVGLEFVYEEGTT